MKGYASRIFTSARLLIQEVVRWPCRECGERVRLWDDVCPECGSYNPLRLPCGMLIHTAFLSVTAILLIQITRMLVWH